MLKRLDQDDTAWPDPVPALLGHLANGNDVLRSAAVRALAVLADERARPALLAALMDEDADVRVDAMTALRRLALSADAEVIRQSLEGDPVREVKLAAIETLTRLRDENSIALLRALAQSRSEDLVAWEDETDVWDDWLDIQVAAIRALGQMQLAEAIPDLLALRDDSLGQNPDVVVFQALAMIPDAGPTALLSVAKTEAGPGRKRALEAFSRSDPNLLRPYLDYLIGDDAADVRALALPLLKASDDRAAYLALKDPDTGIRRKALAMFAGARPELATAALSDDDE